MCEGGRTHVPPSYSQQCLQVRVLALEIVEPGVAVTESTCWSWVISRTKKFSSYCICYEYSFEGRGHNFQSQFLLQ